MILRLQPNNTLSPENEKIVLVEGIGQKREGSAIDLIGSSRSLYLCFHWTVQYYTYGR